MKVLFIGAEGRVGSCIYARLKNKCEVVTAARQSGTLRMDITSEESIKKALEEVGEVDAIVCAAGTVKWGVFENLNENDFYLGIQSKMMGQINLVRLGTKYLKQGGSITLTSGILCDDPVNGSTCAAMVNGALNGFVKAVSRESLCKFRINVISPGLLQNSAAALADAFPGHVPVSGEDVAAGYLKSIFGNITGEVIRVQ